MEEFINYLIGFRDGVDKTVEHIIDTLKCSDDEAEETKKDLMTEVLNNMQKLVNLEEE